jgi:hypothetical protein
VRGSGNVSPDLKHKNADVRQLKAILAVDPSRFPIGLKPAQETVAPVAPTFRLTAGKM